MTYLHLSESKHWQIYQGNCSFVIAPILTSGTRKDFRAKTAEQKRDMKTGGGYTAHICTSPQKYTACSHSQSQQVDLPSSSRAAHTLKPDACGEEFTFQVSLNLDQSLLLLAVPPAFRNITSDRLFQENIQQSICLLNHKDKMLLLPDAKARLGSPGQPYGGPQNSPSSYGINTLGVEHHNTPCHIWINKSCCQWWTG